MQTTLRVEVIKTSTNAKILFQDGKEFDLSMFFATKSGKKRTLKYLIQLGTELKSLVKVKNISMHSEIEINQKQTLRANDVKNYVTYIEVPQNEIMLPLNGCKIVFEPKNNKEKKESIFCVINDDSMGVEHTLQENHDIFSIRTATGFNLLGKKVGDEVVYAKGGVQRIGIIERIDSPSKCKWIFKSDLPKEAKEDVVPAEEEMAA